MKWSSLQFTVYSSQLAAKNASPFVKGGLRGIYLFLFMLLPLSANAAELTASVDRNQVALNETLTLSVRLNEQVMFGDPDFSALENSFEILSRQQQSQLSFNNGQKESYVTWQLTLMPRKKGKLLIPSFNFKGAVSDAIEITVTDKPVSQGKRQSIFTETVLEPKSVYVQEQALLTLRFYTAVAVDNFGMTELKLPDASVTKVHESQFQKNINGINYQVVELRFALFPGKSGTLKIPAVRFSGTIPDRNDPFSGSFFNRGKPMAITTDAASLEVKPRPPGIAASDWLPSKGISIAQRWNRKPESLVVGEPITRSLIISAQGLTGAQLPPLELQGGNGFKVYPDQPEIEDEPTEAGVIGKRIESYAIVPTQPGTITLPPVTLEWWDSVNQQLRKTELAAQTLNVLPAKDSSNAPSNPSPTNSVEIAGPDTDATAAMSEQQDDASKSVASSRVLIALLISNTVLLILVLLFAGLWWRDRKKPQAAQDKKAEEQLIQGRQLTKTLQQAADNNDLPQLRETTLLWAQARWPNHNITGLQQIAELADSESLKTQFQQLDKALYAPSGLNSALDTKQLVKTLLDLPQPSRKKTGADGLRPLYPQGDV